MTKPNSSPETDANNGPKNQAQRSAKQLTKKEMILKGISQKSGITLETLCQQTGWQPHSIRAIFSTLRKSGVEIACIKQNGKPSLYHIVEDGEAA